MTVQRGWRVLALSAAWFSFSCSSSDGPPEAETRAPDDYTEASARLFDPERRFEVELEIDPGEWRKLGSEGRGLSAASCDRANTAPDPLEYTWFHASAIIDGEPLDDIAVRKKGFLGSLSVTRPSVRIGFDTFQKGREWSGMEKLTLNNNRQDPSMIRQCTTYFLFRRAGVPAPRCTFAHVTVNGDELGTYSHVEGVTRRFLRAHFGDDSGQLYEGQGGDFLSTGWGGFEPKTAAAEADSSDLERVREALLADESERLSALESVIDLDAYLTYWAMEALTAHWDSYSTTRNNYLLYDDPGTGFHFIPWGTDATLDEAGLVQDARPQSISADSDLSRALFTLPEARERYVKRVRELLDAIWDEDEILAEVDRAAALLPDSDPDAVESIREFVLRRREVVTAELDAGPEPLPVSRICFAPGGSISGTFRGVVGDSDDPGAFELVVDGAKLDLTEASVTGTTVQVAGPPGPGVELRATDAAGAAIRVQLQIERRLFAPGALPLHALSDLAFVTGIPAAGSPLPFQFVSDGSITLDAAGTAPGEAVAGAFEGRLYALRQ